MITLTFTADTAEDILRDLNAFRAGGIAQDILDRAFKGTYPGGDGVALFTGTEHPNGALQDPVEPEPVPAPKAKPKAEAKPEPKPAPKPEPKPEPAAEPEAKPEEAGLTYDDVREAVLLLVEAKGKEELSALFGPFGVTTAKDVDRSLWPELVAACKERMV